MSGHFPAHPEPLPGSVEAPSAAILSFPARIPAPVQSGASRQGSDQARVLELGTRGQWCGVLYVARMLRLEAVELRTVVAHIRAHIARSGFPHPASSRLRHGMPVTGAGAVTPKSEWLRASVDAWVAARHAASLSSTGQVTLAQDRAAQIDATLSARLTITHRSGDAA